MQSSILEVCGAADTVAPQIPHIERRTTLIPNHYDHEQLAQSHRQYLLHEAEHEQLLAQLPDPDHSRLALPTRLVPFLRVLRTGTLSLMSIRVRAS